MGFYFLTLFYILLRVFPHFMRFCLSLCVLQCSYMGLLQKIGFGCMGLVVFVARLLNMFAIMIIFH